MDKLTKFMDEKLSGPMSKLANQRHLRAIRDGIVATLPLIIVASFFMIVAAPPLPETWGITQTLKANAGQILLPFRMTMSLMTLYAVFGIGLSLAKSYDLDGLSGGIIATVTFLLTFTPKMIDPELGLEASGWVIETANMGGGGMFVGIITAIIGVEIFKFTDRSNFKVTMPEQVPPAVARSFEALVPMAIVMILMGIISYGFGFDWHGVVGTIVRPLVSASDSLPAVLLLVFLNSFLWSFGIHGASIVGSVARPIWLDLFDQNTAAVAAGKAATELPAIAAEPFYQWFIYIGGSGATIGLAIAMFFFAKSSYAKSLGKTVIAPSIFNINEPVIFGAPIVLNPILMIPFIIAPLVMATIAWVAMRTGIVGRVSVTPPWTFPGPVGAFLATKDWKGAVLSVILIAVSTAIYYPFFKIYDNELLAEETAGEKAE